jgi:hypothetical protein
MSKIRQVTVPLAIESIKEFFQDKEIKFIVDYDNSKIKNQIFLTYVSNLDIPVDLKISDNFDEDVMFTLLDHYMTVKTITDIPYLNTLVEQIILRAAGNDSKGHLTAEQADRYIETRPETIAMWLAFLNSIPLYMCYSFKELNDEYKVEENSQIIDDDNAVGLNVVNLLHSAFMIRFFSTDISNNEPFWFRQQFESYMFKGKSLYEFVAKLKDFIGLMIAVHDKKLPADAGTFFDSKELTDKVKELY